MPAVHSVIGVSLSLEPGSRTVSCPLCTQPTCPLNGSNGHWRRFCLFETAARLWLFCLRRAGYKLSDIHTYIHTYIHNVHPSLTGGILPCPPPPGYATVDGVLYLWPLPLLKMYDLIAIEKHVYYYYYCHHHRRHHHHHASEHDLGLSRNSWTAPPVDKIRWNACIPCAGLDVFISRPNIDNVVHVPRVLQFIADCDRTSRCHYSPSHYAT